MNPIGRALSGRANEKWTNDAVGREAPIGLPGPRLHLWLPVLQPMLDRRGHRHATARLRVAVGCNCREYGIPFCNCLPLRPEEQLPPLAGPRVAEVQHVPGVEHGGAGG